MGNTNPHIGDPNHTYIWGGGMNPADIFSLSKMVVGQGVENKTCIANWQMNTPPPSALSPALGQSPKKKKHPPGRVRPQLSVVWLSSEDLPFFQTIFHIWNAKFRLNTCIRTDSIIRFAESTSSDINHIGKGTLNGLGTAPLWE